MTKEELMKDLGENESVYVERKLKEFFDAHICFPKGENRHPYADVLHTYVEDINQTLEYLNVGNQWEHFIALSVKEFRIKPSEPVYEYQWCVIMDDGTGAMYGYHTEEGINNLFDKRNKFRIESSKRIRSQRKLDDDIAELKRIKSKACSNCEGRGYFDSYGAFGEYEKRTCEKCDGKGL